MVVWSLFVFCGISQWLFAAFVLCRFFHSEFTSAVYAPFSLVSAGRLLPPFFNRPITPNFPRADSHGLVNFYNFPHGPFVGFALFFPYLWANLPWVGLDPPHPFFLFICSTAGAVKFYPFIFQVLVLGVTLTSSFCLSVRFLSVTPPNSFDFFYERLPPFSIEGSVHLQCRIAPSASSPLFPVSLSRTVYR